MKALPRLVSLSYMKHSSSNVCLRVFRKGVCKKTAKNIILVNKSISSRYNGDIGVGVLAKIRDTLFEDVDSFFIDRQLIDLKREDTARRASDWEAFHLLPKWSLSRYAWQSVRRMGSIIEWNGS